MDPVNLKLVDAAIRHELLLRRFAAHEIEQVIGALNTETFPDLLARIQKRLERTASRGQDSLFAQSRGADDLREAVAKTLDEAFSQASSLVAADMAGLAAHEADWIARAIDQAIPRGISIDWKLPAPNVLKALIEDRPMQGQVLGEWFSGLAQSTASNIERQINIGIAQSESLDEIVRRVRGTKAANFEDGVLQTTRRNAAGIVRTAISHTSAQAREMSYEANSDIIDSVLWVSTLDGRTTLTCIALDGQTFKINEGPRPPAHWACRSSTAPVLKSWKELGFSFDELSDGTRASMNGEVPGAMTYGEWLARQPASFQDHVLGPARAKLFRSGSLTVKDFVDSKWEPLTLQQLIAHIE